MQGTLGVNLKYLKIVGIFFTPNFLSSVFKILLWTLDSRPPMIA